MIYLHTLRQQLGLIFAILAFGYVFWRGGKPERIAGVVMALAWFVSPYLVNTHNRYAPPWGVFALDLALLGFLIWMALGSHRYWPMWAAALHGLGVLMHAMRNIEHRILPQSYMTASGIWGYLVVIALIVGVMLEAAPARSARAEPASDLPPPGGWR